MRKIVVAMVALALPFVGAGPASADPARTSAAGAFGIAGTGLLAIPPTPTATATQPPDTNIPLTVPAPNFNAVLPLDVGGLAVDATVAAAAQATRESTIQAALDGVNDNVNARGFARIEGLQLLGEATLIEALGLPLDAPGLLTAGLIEAEAVATCVNNAPVFDVGFNIVDLELAEIDLGAIVDPLLGSLLGALNLPGILEVIQGEQGFLPDGSGVFINALRIRVLGNVQDIVIGHAEARMPANCAVEPPAEPPTGPGDVAPTGTLAATGSSPLLLPVALGLLATAGGLRYLNRRSRRTSTSA